MPRVRGRSIEWLLALLVLRHGRAVDRSWLAGTLWSESEEGQARHNLSDALTHLRKALGSEGGRIQSPSRETLTLDLTGADVDLLVFDRAIQAGDEAALRNAVDCYAAPLLEGCYEAWVGLERENREQACLAVLETLADRAGERGNASEAIRYLRKAEALDPLRDTVARRLMTALQATGDSAAAIEVYHRLRHRLHEELAADPDAATTRLFQEIRQQGREGEKGSKNLLNHPLLPLSPSPLPHPLTALIGRAQEIREIAEALASSRMVTLIGGGGVGKTRLAIEAARAVSPRFAQGVAFVALASLSDAALLPAFVATALGIEEETGPDASFLIRALVGWLLTHEVLLVLDNCEHLIEATAALTQTLLERCPDLHILATSRQRLGLTGEVAWRVPSLPVPEPEPISERAKNGVETALDYPAIRLFVERAAMARPGFRLTEIEDARAVAQICHRLDGIPLAIELAAARVNALRVGQIATRLDDRFQLLTGGARTALPRHQTLGALIDWSYHLLTTPEQAMLCRLSVFAGRWTLEVAEAVCEYSETPNAQHSGTACVSH